jgi:hypothetical protein
MDGHTSEVEAAVAAFRATLEPVFKVTITHRQPTHLQTHATGSLGTSLSLISHPFAPPSLSLSLPPYLCHYRPSCCVL